MKKILSMLFLLFILFLGYLYPFNIYAKSYTVNSLDVNVYLNEYGDAEIEETWVVDYSGSFSRFYKNIYLDLPKDESISQISNWSVSIDGVDCERTNDIESRTPYTFAIIEEKDKLRYEIYSDTNSEIREFQIRYTLEDVVKYVDNSYYLFVMRCLPDGYKDNIENLNVRISTFDLNTDIIGLYNTKGIEKFENGLYILEAKNCKDMYKVRVRLENINIGVSSENYLTDSELSSNIENIDNIFGIFLVLFCLMLIMVLLVCDSYLTFTNYKKTCEEKKGYLYKIEFWHVFLENTFFIILSSQEILFIVPLLISNFVFYKNRSYISKAYTQVYNRIQYLMEYVKNSRKVSPFIICSYWEAFNQIFALMGVHPLSLFNYNLYKMIENKEIFISPNQDYIYYKDRDLEKSNIAMLRLFNDTIKYSIENGKNVILKQKKYVDYNAISISAIYYYINNNFVDFQKNFFVIHDFMDKKVTKNVYSEIKRLRKIIKIMKLPKLINNESINNLNSPIEFLTFIQLNMGKLEKNTFKFLSNFVEFEYDDINNSNIITYNTAIIGNYSNGHSCNSCSSCSSCSSCGGCGGSD